MNTNISDISPTSVGNEIERESTHYAENVVGDPIQTRGELPPDCVCTGLGATTQSTYGVTRITMLYRQILNDGRLSDVEYPIDFYHSDPSAPRPNLEWFHPLPYGYVVVGMGGTINKNSNFVDVKVHYMKYDPATRRNVGSILSSDWIIERNQYFERNFNPSDVIYGLQPYLDRIALIGIGMQQKSYNLYAIEAKLGYYRELAAV